MKITTDYLRSLEACKSGIDAFSNLFPGGEAELNSENLSKARCGGLDVTWLVERIDDQYVLVTLSTDESEWVREAVSLNPSTPPTTLATLSKDASGRVRRGVAFNPNTPPATLVKLSDDKNLGGRCGVARNPSTPPATLAKLSKDDDYLVRRGVARNPNTPPATLAKLSDDKNLGVREAVSRNPAYTGSRGSALIATNEELVR